ncbi:MAG: cytochrome c [Epsilonproteobacteria bacterium]|nr:cytochrome c [Campylobacterota bacterium]
MPLQLLSTDFITNLEYGKMLYQNPRGIGCIKCHAKYGHGRLVAKYRDKNGNLVKLVAPDITKTKWETFYVRLKYSKIFKNHKLKKINYSFMPKYDYLVDEEIQAIYHYLHSKKH